MVGFGEWGLQSQFHRGRFCKAEHAPFRNGSAARNIAGCFICQNVGAARTKMVHRLAPLKGVRPRKIARFCKVPPAVSGVGIMDEIGIMGFNIWVEAGK